MLTNEIAIDATKVVDIENTEWVCNMVDASSVSGPQIKISKALAASIERREKYDNTPASKLKELGFSRPSTVFGVVNHPSHGLIALTESEVKSSGIKDIPMDDAILILSKQRTESAIAANCTTNVFFK